MQKIRRDFENGRHDYFIQTKEGEVKAISVSQLLSRQGISPHYDGGNSIVRASAEKGTKIHKMLEEYHNFGEIAVSDDFLYIIEEEKKLFGDKDKYKFVSEFPVCKDCDGFYLAGTIDGLVKTQEGKIYIVDYKTGNSKDADRWQVSFYKYLVESNSKNKIDGLYIINSKERKVEKVKEVKTEELEKVLDYERQGKVLFEEKEKTEAKAEEIPSEFRKIDKERAMLSYEKVALCENSEDVKKYLQILEDEKTLNGSLKKLALDIEADSIETEYGRSTKYETKTIDKKLLQETIERLGGSIEDVEKCYKTTLNFKWVSLAKENERQR